MNSPTWSGLREEAKGFLEQRDYSKSPLSQRVARSGVAAFELAKLPPDADERRGIWIPGFEIFPVTTFIQRHRGTFSELARNGQGRLGEIGFWPKQWSTSLLHAGTAKGFHVHPPYIPEESEASDWFQSLYGQFASTSLHRPYDQEQWDVMYFLTGSVEVLLVDERAGLPRRILRFFVQGYDRPGPDNVAIVIPPGVAHAIRTATGHDVLMVYGTSTMFDPRNEGRLFSGIEQAALPEDWRRYLGFEI
jgi:dTDP-4-dehydrorhamnose 3,5-epimerase-like enzyme